MLQAKKGRPGRPSEEASGSLPQAADRRICSWEQFEACRLEYDDKFGRLAALQQLCTKFDRYLYTTIVSLWYTSQYVSKNRRRIKSE